MAHKIGLSSAPAKTLFWLNAASWAVMAVGLHNLVHIALALLDPLQLDYSEALVIGGLWRIGQNPALSAAYSFNANFYNTTDLAYPPVFPYVADLVAQFLKLFGDFGDRAGALTALYAARSLTFVAFLAIGGLIYSLARRFEASRLIALASAALFFCFHPAIYWGVYARVDALGVALVLAGLRLAVAKDSRWLWLALPFFGLAFYTKQSLVAGAGAVVLYLWLAGMRKRAMLFAALLSLIVASVFGLLMVATGGNFWFFITLERATPFSVIKLLGTIALFGLLYAVICGAAVWHTTRNLLNRTSGLARLLAIWGMLAFLVSLTVGKNGAADYYYFELMAFVSLQAALVVVKLKAFRRWQVGLVFLQIAVLVGVAFYFSYPLDNHENVREADRRAAAYVKAAGPSSAIFAENSGPLITAGRPDQIFDHFIFRQLARAGLRDGQALVNDFAQKRFKVALFGYDVLRYDIRPDVTDPTAWPTGFEAAVRDHYQLAEAVRGRNSQVYIWVLIPKS